MRVGSRSQVDILPRMLTAAFFLDQMTYKTQIFSHDARQVSVTIHDSLTRVSKQRNKNQHGSHVSLFPASQRYPVACRLLNLGYDVDYPDPHCQNQSAQSIFLRSIYGGQNDEGVADYLAICIELRARMRSKAGSEMCEHKISRSVVNKSPLVLSSSKGN
jgi:hypothetical protein